MKLLQKSVLSFCILKVWNPDCHHPTREISDSLGVPSQHEIDETFFQCHTLRLLNLSKSIQHSNQRVGQIWTSQEVIIE